MKRIYFLFLVVSVSLIGFNLVPFTTQGKSEKFFRTENGIPGRYIVVFNSDGAENGAFDPSAESKAYDMAGAYNASVEMVYNSAVKGFAGAMSDRDAELLSRDPRVAFVEQDAYASVADVQTTSDWGLDRIDQRVLPLNGAFMYAETGQGVNAYIIDTGIRPTHQDFGGRAVAAYDVVGDGQNGNDCNGHGTHVAGTIGSATYGVAKNVNLYGVRVFGCTGSGTVSGIISGVNWVTANRVNPAVVNMSIIVSSVSNSLNTAINNSINSGVTYVVASGNFNRDACLFSPGSVTNAITVGATGNNDARATYSNFGSCVDIFAPGNGITSLGITSDTATAVKSGTSMASPMVAGAAALYLESNPTASPAEVANRISLDSTTGTVTNIDTVSPNKLLYSWLGDAVPPTPGTVTIVKEVTDNHGGTASTASFSYTATNLGTQNFTLVDNDMQPADRFINGGVFQFGLANAVTVTEANTNGWQLTSINCVETPGGGLPNIQNSTVNLTAKSASLVVEEGESITCTFTSNQLIPTAARASVTGRIVKDNGNGIRGVTLSLQNAMTGEIKHAMTNSFGYYTFEDLEVMHLYVLTAHENKRMTFSPNNRTFSLDMDMFDMNFTAITRD